MNTAAFAPLLFWLVVFGLIVGYIASRIDKTTGTRKYLIGSVIGSFIGLIVGVAIVSTMLKSEIFSSAPWLVLVAYALAPLGSIVTVVIMNKRKNRV